MRHRTLKTCVGLGVALTLGLSAAAGAQTPTATLTADTTAAGKHMSDDLYGIFYEDINHAADGGLYGELVQNRSFEFSTVDNGSYTPTTAWAITGGTMAAATQDPLNAKNLNYLRVTGAATLRNSGFNTGIPVVTGNKYDVSFWARAAAPATVRASVDGASDAFTATVDSTWKKYTGVVTASATTTTGRLQLVTDGSVDLDMVSLFPQDTFMGRSNGLRKDIAQKIADLNPSFMRFPGGCIVNMNGGSGNNYGDYTNARARVYRWKETIGPVEERPTNRNMWGYNQSYGLGYMEYFQYSEDIGASPLPVVPVGTNSCGGTTRLTTDAQLEPWIQDTLDLIQFANGSIATEWGAKRAALGHPEPFNLKYLGLGNEESDPQWNINFPKFVQRVRAVYPDVKLIATSGWAADGTEFQRNWTTARSANASLVDEHYYPGPEWFLSNSHRYDNYDRNGPHVFVGEYATRSTYDRAFNSGLAEAAFMTGLERNSDVVDLASYAPLLANVDYVNWEPDLLYYDNSRIFGTPSYYVQKLFSNNRGDTIVPSTLTADSSTPVETPITGRIGLATWSTQAAYDNVKVTAKDGTVLFSDDFSGGADQWTASNGTWSVVNGEYRQTGTGTDLRSIAGNAGWSNYTLELDARKISGAEGFLIQFGAADANNFYWWNLGGWNNTVSAIEKATGGTKTNIGGSSDTITTGQTYHLKITVDGRHITTFIDGRKVNDFVDPQNTVEPLYQVVTKDSQTKDVLVKVVNARTRATTAAIDLGATPFKSAGTVTTMSADALTDVNSFANPTKVVPVEKAVSGLGNKFNYEFPASSITFIRLHQGRPGEPIKDSQIAAVGGDVPATLSLKLGTPPTFGQFILGEDKEYVAATTATVNSSAGDAALTVSDPGKLTNGAYSLAEPLRVEFSKASWTAPVANDPVTITFKQHIGANDALRTGRYGKTLTFTLSTTTP